MSYSPEIYFITHAKLNTIPSYGNVNVRIVFRVNDTTELEFPPHKRFFLLYFD